MTAVAVRIASLVLACSQEEMREVRAEEAMRGCVERHQELVQAERELLDSWSDSRVRSLARKAQETVRGVPGERDLAGSVAEMGQARTRLVAAMRAFADRVHELLGGPAPCDSVESYSADAAIREARWETRLAELEYEIAFLRYGIVEVLPNPRGRGTITQPGPKRLFDQLEQVSLLQATVQQLQTELITLSARVQVLETRR